MIIELIHSALGIASCCIIKSLSPTLMDKNARENKIATSLLG